jgi:hypothetical protein
VNVDQVGVVDPGGQGAGVTQERRSSSDAEVSIASNGRFWAFALLAMQCGLDSGASKA